ncbi:hypothetical protein [Paenarthrobacter sp. A20]|uniref:hypothetical protein n=1 Tax=Paenarthrobacter sp. A20 TaxID=2817891 RepID=UPI00209C84A4|nr:hypothetical protein [Paenarthrobacter sp. A20]MCP1413580.1 hypothetical protein [Paenarthrobacter sp. A20]
MSNTARIHGSPDIVHFFIPLPDPIRVPNLTELAVRYAWDPISDDGPCFRLPAEGNVDYASRRIMIFHQSEVLMDVAPFAAAMQLMNSSIGASGVSPADTSASDSPALPVAQTTVEVISVLEPDAKDPLEHAFETALDVVNDFQTYFHLISKTPLRRLTRKLLPPLLPIILRPFASQNWQPDFLHVNDGGPALRAASTPTLSQDQLQNLLRHNRAARAEVFTAFMLMRQEAMLSYAVGSTAAASLFVAIAAETLLTELFLLLSWEESANLSKTADVLGERDNISKRLLNELAGKLKGDWDRGGEGPLGNWQRHIADLRNAVAHAGKLPTEAEITSAMTALTALETHVGDQLAKSIRRFPLSAEIFLGNKGLEERGRFHAWQRQVATLEIPVHASEIFSRWKAEVERIRSGPLAGNFDKSYTAVVRFGNGAERWYLVDDERNLSCAVHAPNLTEFSRSHLDKTFTESDFDVTTLEVRSLRLPPPQNPQWVPSYLVLPSASIDRWEHCLWVPPKC